MLRILYRHHYSFFVHPIYNVTRATKAETWIATGPQPRLSLQPTEGRWPQGWVLFRSRIFRRTNDYQARLYLDVGDGFTDERALIIPVTQKGTIHELIFLPHGLVGLQWSPIGAAGSFEQTPILMTEVGDVERTYRMGWRVFSMHKKLSREERVTSGLSYYRMLVDLSSAYRTAGTLRAYSPPSHTGRWVEHYRENGFAKVRIHGDAVIATLEQAAASLFVQSSANIQVSPIEMSLIRRYLFPYLIDQMRQSYDSECISVPLQQPLFQSKSKP